MYIAGFVCSLNVEHYRVSRGKNNVVVSPTSAQAVGQESGSFRRTPKSEYFATA